MHELVPVYFAMEYYKRDLAGSGLKSYREQASFVSYLVRIPAAKGKPPGKAAVS